MEIVACMGIEACDFQGFVNEVNELNRRARNAELFDLIVTVDSIGEVDGVLTYNIELMTMPDAVAAWDVIIDLKFGD